MTRRLIVMAASACLSLLLSACLFRKDENTFSYTAELSGKTKTVYAYNTDGSIYRNLGVGIVMEYSLRFFGDPDDVFLYFWPASTFLSSDDSLSFNESVLTEDDYFPVNPEASRHFARITRDSTHVGRIQTDVLFSHFVVERSFSGFPCSFSRLKAYQIATNGDTIPLKVSGTHLDRVDTLRFALLIDTHASLAADARVDFAKDVTGTVRLTCPHLEL